MSYVMAALYILPYNVFKNCKFIYNRCAGSCDMLWLNNKSLFSIHWKVACLYITALWDYVMYHGCRLICLEGRVFASGSGDRGSIPGQVIPKTFKMVLDTSLFKTQEYKVRIKGKVEQSWERSSAPLHFGVVATEKVAFLSPSTKVANLTNLLYTTSWKVGSFYIIHLQDHDICQLHYTSLHRTPLKFATSYMHLCRGVKPSPMSVLDMTLNNRMVRFQRC